MFYKIFSISILKLPETSSDHQVMKNFNVEKDLDVVCKSFVNSQKNKKLLKYCDKVYFIQSKF